MTTAKPKKRVILSTNPLEPNSYEIFEDVTHLKEFLMFKFRKWPDTAKIYHEYVSQATDVTPFDETTVEKLDDLEGDVFVVVYPEGFIAIIILVVALVAVTVLLKPKIPDVSADAAARNQQSSSPNNELAARTNKARLTARIPDIYGTVRSTPDLIQQTYNYYENNKKVEIAYMCVGRGEYVISDVRDSDTPLSYIPGSAAHFYLPNQSPNSGDDPFYSVGSDITDLLYRAEKLEQVVGQEMRAPNSASVTGASNIKFQYPDRIYNSVGINFQDRFVDGDQVQITGATFTGTAATIVETRTARYVDGGGSPYVEWQTGNPNTPFNPGDSLIIGGASKTMAVKPFTESRTMNMRFTDTGRIYFDDTGGDTPQELGDDFRINKDFVLSGAVFNYNFQGTYDITAKTTTVLTLDNPAAVNADWNAINGNTGYTTVTVAGISRSVRFRDDGSMELQSGNWNDIDYPATVTSVVVGSAPYTTNLNGTYQFTSTNSGADYWVLSSPSSVNAEWNEINGTTGYVSATVQQTHSTDTQAEDFSGTYTIASLTSTRIYLTNPGAVNSAWNRLTDYVNDRSEYSDTDTFTVNSPSRTVNLNGTYTVVSVGLYELILSNPAGVTTDWNELDYFASDQVTPTAPYIATTGGNWIGPFFINNPNTSRIVSSFQAPNGLYTDDGTDQQKKQVQIEMLIYPCDADGNITGAAQNPGAYMTGSAVQRDLIGYTINVGLTTPGYCLIYARRMTAKDTAFEGSVVDLVKWEEVYALSPETISDFGDITTVYTKTYATGGALALKERKLNCLAQRKIPYITGWSGVYPNYTPVYDPDLQPTNTAWQIAAAIAIDPKFGGRDPSEVDFYNLATASNEVYEYFGSDPAVTEFSYTFDNTNISFEEAFSAIANVTFCVAYRQGSLLKWKPDIATNPPVLLFNHRNKLPDTETRTVRFANQNDYDSIEMQWINPNENDSVETFFVPEDQSGIAPKKIDTIGIRNITQATYHAYRNYYQVKYQNTVAEFESTQEAAILLHRDKVMLADNTRADTQDGEIVDQEILQLTLSQEVNFADGKTYTMFIQHIDGSVEGIPVTAVDDSLFIVKNVYILQAGGVRFPTVADAGNLRTGDKVRLVSTSFVDPVNGSLNFDNTAPNYYVVSSVDATTGIVLFDNPSAIDADWAKITETEHLRAGVNFISERNAKRTVNLAHAPYAPLSLDPSNFARATYVIRANDETAPNLFQVQDTIPKDNYTYRVSLVNFDARVYYLDDLQFWLNFDDGTFRDASAQAHNVSISGAAGKATIAYDAKRGQVTYQNVTNSSAAFVNSSDLVANAGSYTKAAWVRQNGGFDNYFLSNAYEAFRVNNNNRIIAGHDTMTGGTAGLTSVLWPVADDEWHHACCTYDADAQILRLYVDGLIVAQKTGVPLPSSSTNLQPVGNGSSGCPYPACDDVRYWHRCFTDAQVAELYNGTR